ncbi:glycosyltransferase [Marinifilum sp. D714]|uniref:glycosyltransferase family 2 protein n=1 Tax=Marinifilum sp. D714 TaxID=2937523 RepID=UPI0027BD2334|nr:glycosyltransferase [Marinifilum sp. D714]MDQ2179815.1 glycosyltransferase [Marinifilum sp. D714]
MNFSVLLSVYYRENPIFLKAALNSIWSEQTVKPSEIVLVKDGPLSEPLDQVIDEFRNVAPLKVIALEKNVGLGMALNIGLEKCNYELVARMDTDDIAFKTRFEKQLCFLVNNPEIDIVGSWLDEFESTPDNVISQRRVPESAIEIKEFLKKRNPLNHPTVVFRKSSVQKVGGYKHFHLNEDYYLWARMVASGSKLYNIQESLLYFRAGREVFKRRGGFNYALQDYKLQKEFKRLGIVNRKEFIINCCTRCTSRLLPNFIRGALYKKLLRN